VHDGAAVVANDLHVAVDKPDLEALLEHGHLAGERVERPRVVAVEQLGGIVLAQRAIDRVRDEALSVVRRDDGGHLGPGERGIAPRIGRSRRGIETPRRAR
jgi:hypothetical protein